MVDIEVELARGLFSLPQRALEGLISGLTGAALIVKLNLEIESPVDKGELAHSYNIGSIRPLSKISAEITVTSSAPYVYVVAYGRKEPLEIFPVHAKTLRFMIGNEIVFAKRVVLPPTKGDNFIGRAVERALPGLGKKVGREVVIHLA